MQDVGVGDAVLASGSVDVHVTSIVSRNYDTPPVFYGTPSEPEQSGSSVLPEGQVAGQRRAIGPAPAPPSVSQFIVDRLAMFAAADPGYLAPNYRQSKSKGLSTFWYLVVSPQL
jgi:hypothetical protein